MRKFEEQVPWEAVNLWGPGRCHLDIVLKLMPFGWPQSEINVVGLDPSPLSSPCNCPRPAGEEL